MSPFPRLMLAQTCIHWVHSCSMKDVGLRIRVQRDLREQFLETCRAQDKPAAQVLREFMRDYVQMHPAVEKPGESQAGEKGARPKTL